MCSAQIGCEQHSLSEQSVIPSVDGWKWYKRLISLLKTIIKIIQINAVNRIQINTWKCNRNSRRNTRDLVEFSFVFNNSSPLSSTSGPLDTTTPIHPGLCTFYLLFPHLETQLPSVFALHCVTLTWFHSFSHSRTFISSQNHSYIACARVSSYQRMKDFSRLTSFPALSWAKFPNPSPRM